MAPQYQAKKLGGKNALL